MKIRSLSIKNIKGIKALDLKDIGDVAVIAGPNGCGKSCIFDALKILKTSYGTYSNHETNQLFAALDIKQNEKEGFKSIFRNPKESIFIECAVEFSSHETETIDKILDETIKLDVFNMMRPKASDSDFLSLALPPHQIAEFHKKVAEKTDRIRSKLPEKIHYGKIEIPPSENPIIKESAVIEFVFSHYLPQSIGSIIHISANRSYQKQKVNHINLANINTTNQQAKNSILYDTNSLINLFHQDLASNYINNLIKENLGLEKTNEEYLEKSIHELFEKFIPNKKFKGPAIEKDGTLTFIVETIDGYQHDINELSSGEKEVLMGYVQIYGKLLTDSILMFDEPELHLNPRLIKNLPEFYRKHLGEHFNNQIWLVTHSDALLSEAAKNETYSVFHIIPAETQGADQQAHRISSKNEADQALLELVGDLSQYKPESKIVIVEGENSEFDKKLITKLFKEFSEKVNLISVGPKSKVTSLHNLMENVFKGSNYNNKVYGITDKDFLNSEKSTGRVRSWDSYHIENYLLDPEIISSITQESLNESTHLSSESVHAELKSIAKSLINSLAKQKIQQWINAEIVKSIRINCDDKEENIPEKIKESILGSKSRLISVSDDLMSSKKIEDKYEEARTSLSASFKDSSWMKVFPGREILMAFRKAHASSMSYERFRDSIVAKMAEKQIKPQGMRELLDLIISE